MASSTANAANTAPIAPKNSSGRSIRYSVAMVRTMRQQLRRAQAAAMEPGADALTRIRQGSMASVRFMAEHRAYFTLLDVERSEPALAEVLRAVDEETIAARMAYRYPPGAVRRLDDALLQRYAETYVELEANAHRRPLLSQRLARLREEP